MKRKLLSLLLLFGGILSAGNLHITSGKRFSLPETTAPGGNVFAKLKSRKPLKIRLNGKPLGVFIPQDGVVSVDLTPAVFYNGKNRLESKPQCNGFRLTYEDAVTEPAVITKLRKEKIRLNSSALQSVKRATKLREIGFNIAMGWSHIHKHITPSPKKDGEPLVSKDQMPQLKFLRNEIRVGKESGIIPLPLVWYHKETYALMKQATYDRCHPIGEYGPNKTPCPLDSVYWNRLIKPTLLAVAEIYKELDAPGGIMLDQEFYAPGFPGFTYGGAEDGCFCDSCLKHFFAAVGEKVDPAQIKKPLEYIIKRGYTLQEYQDVLEIRLAKKVRKIALAVRAVKPDFLLGLMPGMGNWYLNGIARGMATPGMPVIISGEDEYFVGLNAHSGENIKNLKRWGWPAFYVPGLTISSYNAEGLGVKSVEAAQRADGYWLYYGEMFFATKPKIILDSVRPSEYALREPSVRYLAALKQANTYLDTHQKPAEKTLDAEKLPRFNSEKFAVSKTGISFRNVTEIPKNLLPKSLKYAKRVRKTAKGTVVFDMGKFGSNKAIANIKVKPGVTYRMTLLFKTKKLSQPIVGFRVKENKKVILRRSPDCHGASDWKKLKSDFTPKTDKIRVEIFACGKTGKFEFKDARLCQVVPFRIQSGKLDAQVSALKLGMGTKCYAELVNPVTNLAYFRLNNGVNDLRLLQEIYGKQPYVVRFSGKLDGNVNFEK